MFQASLMTAVVAEKNETLGVDADGKARLSLVFPCVAALRADRLA